MRERWLQTLWGLQDWNGWPLRTCQGHTLQVLHPGTWNNDQGPDYLGAQIFIDQILWVGSVEIHIQTTDWFRHQHTTDPNYLPVILHVVWMQMPLRPDIPTLELSRYLTIPRLKQALLQLGDITQLACHRLIRPVPQALWIDYRNVLLKSRLTRKRPDLVNGPTGPFRNRLARQMGAWVNRDVFESIDASISERIMSEIRSDVESITALYLGQAGLLEEQNADVHKRRLKQVYDTLRHTHQLNPPYRSLLWMRIRPAAHPVIRLKQLAALVHAGWDDPARWRKTSLSEIFMQLREIHSTDQADSQSEIVFTDVLIQSLLINIWAYLISDEPSDLISRLKNFRWEVNRFTRLFLPLNIDLQTSADSQALLELYHLQCQHRKCSICALANYWSQDQAPQSI